jgi:probable rRNA maturation factor
MIEIACANQQTTHSADETRLTDAARLVLTEEGVADANLSLAVVDDPTIHALNRRYLQHDYPTDVISFVLDPGPPRLEGEVIVSADTAAAVSTRFGWKFEDELLLYVIHGTLHLVGYDDLTEAAQLQMRTAERRYLLRFGLVPRYDEEA